MSQIMFNNGGMRNIGANANQPLITNQNDFQIFDNVTRVAGKHTMKAGGSYTHRSREILNADTIVGRFDFNQNLTSSCGGITSGCTAAANTGFDFASFLLGYASNASRTLFDPGTYTELRPEFAAYFQDDIRVTSRLTVNAGLRWDVYVPWVEEDNKQSNFDVSTGRFVVASDNATINGVEVGRYLQTYSKTDFGPRLGFAYDLQRQRPDDRPRRLRPVLELHARRHLVVEGAEPAVPAGAGDHDELRHQHRAVERAGRASRREPERRRRQDRRGRRSSTDFRDAHAHNFNVNVQRQFGTNYMVEAAYSGSRTKNAALKTDLNQAPPSVGVTRPERQPAVSRCSTRRCARSARCRAPATSNTTAC